MNSQQFRESRAESDYEPQKKRAVPLWLVFFLMIASVTGTIFYFNRSALFGAGTADVGSGGANSQKWQAVFLTTGQVYFGHLELPQADYMTLKDVYYLRAASQLNGSSSDQAGFDLVKIGGELHGPEDEIHILKTSVMFWEDLRQDSRVVQTIAGFMLQKSSGR